MDKPTTSAVIESQVLVNLIRPLLAGHEPEVQSAALADLLAMWLAGHFVTTGKTAIQREQRTARYRERLLADHVKLVRRLVPPNEHEILARTKAASS